MGHKCDVCSRPVRQPKGFAMTTRQVVTRPAYWEYAFTHQWSYIQDICSKAGVETEAAEVLQWLVASQAGSQTPWLVCERCIDLFGVDRTKAGAIAQGLWSEPQVQDAGWERITGDAPPDMCLKAAAEAWNKVFGAPSLATLLGSLRGSGQVLLIKREALQRLGQKRGQRAPREAAATEGPAETVADTGSEAAEPSSGAVVRRSPRRKRRPRPPKRKDSAPAELAGPHLGLRLEDLRTVVVRCHLRTYGASPIVKVYRDHILAARVEDGAHAMYGLHCPQCGGDLLLLVYPQVRRGGFLMRCFARILGMQELFTCYRLLGPLGLGARDYRERLAASNRLCTNFVRRCGGSLDESDAISFSVEHSIRRIDGKRVLEATRLARRDLAGLDRVFRDPRVSDQRIASLLEQVPEWLRGGSGF